MRRARRKKLFCINGHEIAIVGRDKYGNCNQCSYERKKQWKLSHPGIDKDYRETHREELAENGKVRYRLQKDKILIRNKKWRDGHKEKIFANKKEYYEAHKKEILEKRKQWAKEHPESRNASIIKCQTNRALRVVAWTDWNNIKIIDKNKPNGMTLDHIIPLQGDEVSGLHVSWNLQYLPKASNSSKNNKCNLLTASEWYGKILQQAGLK